MKRKNNRKSQPIGNRLISFIFYLFGNYYWEWFEQRSRLHQSNIFWRLRVVSYGFPTNNYNKWETMIISIENDRITQICGVGVRSKIRIRNDFSNPINWMLISTESFQLVFEILLNVFMSPTHATTTQVVFGFSPKISKSIRALPLNRWMSISTLELMFVHTTFVVKVFSLFIIFTTDQQPGKCSHSFHFHLKDSLSTRNKRCSKMNHLELSARFENQHTICHLNRDTL